MKAKVISMNKPVTKRTNWHVKSAFRLSLFITLSLIILISLLSAFLMKGKAAEVPDHYLLWEVKSGDTLWSIAKKSLPKGRDIRDYIYEIKEVNQLQTANIIVGRQLQIPIYQANNNDIELSTAAAN
jgi:hypothetical protein